MKLDNWLKSVGALMLTVGLAAPTDTIAAGGRFLDVNGHRTHFIDRGKGPALELLHGLGADLSRWQANVEILAKSHRVVALDLLGFGASAKPAIDYRAQLYVDQLVALLDVLGIESATLVGNSMGGWVSLLFAEQHPARVERLVFVAPAFVFGLPNGVSARRLAKGAGPRTEQEMAAYLARVYHRSPAIKDPTYLETALKARLAKGDRGTIQAMANAIAAGQDVFTPQRISALRVRTLIIHGDSDGVVPLDASRHLQERLPNAELTVVPKAGHWPQLENAAYFNRTLLAWLP